MTDQLNRVAPPREQGTPTRPARPGRGEARFALFLLLPAAFVVFGVVVYPVVRTLVMSVLDVDGPLDDSTPFVGVSNYAEALADPGFWRAVWQTSYFSLTSIFFEIVFGVGIALLLNAPLRARWLFRAIVIVPWALPTIVSGAMWRYIFSGQYGALNALLTQVGLMDEYRSWLGADPFLALNMVIAADVWKNTSLVAFLLLAGLQNIPSDLYEAARIDGAGPIRSFFSITVPMLVPSIVIVLVLRTIDTVRIFDIVYIITGGGPASGTQTVAFYTYVRAFSDQRLGYGSALSYLVTAVVLVLSIVYLRTLRKRGALL
ncbi:sugar ABC transporter permease [Longispora sp. NPDC051575]|uniref:carbohydrate ABC transporter permease n=1 Tax=Longispora sp. NPDC051575 TaxID=3154943 RepID=UPI003442EDB6